MTAEPVWQLEGMVKEWRAGGLLRPTSVHTAVAGVSLEARAGERIGLVGESGSGKTTLALAGLGLISHEGGRVRLFGDDTESWGSARWRQVRQHAQMLFQNPRSMLNPAMPVGLVLEESAALHRPDHDAEALARDALESVGLSGRWSARIHELSGGEVRRAGVARLLLAQPRLVVADEPTAGLDAALKASLVELLLERVGPDCTVVLISHDIPLVAWACERILVMQGGHIVDRFATSEITSPGEGADARHPYTLQLLAAAGVHLEARRAEA